MLAAIAAMDRGIERWRMDIARVEYISPTELKRVRKIYGYTQAELAKACGVAPSTVASWEAGKSWPRPKTLKKLNCILFQKFSRREA